MNNITTPCSIHTRKKNPSSCRSSGLDNAGNRAAETAVFACRRATRTASLTVLLALVAIAPCLADDTSPPVPDSSSSPGPVADYFKNWFQRVSATQAEQPHWITPLVTVTPRLEEEVRYDIYREEVSNGHILDVFGTGKGLELIPAEHVEVIIALPSWETEDVSPNKHGWADQTFLLKYRWLSANEKNGNYILTTFLGLSAPWGDETFTSHHYAWTPTIAFGKGWGDFDIQSTAGVSIPDNGVVPNEAGTPVSLNTTFQYRLLKVIWPELETNYTYYPNGEHAYKNQLLLTPGVVLGRFSIWERAALTVGVGYQVAVTSDPLVRNNLILSGRVPF